MGFDLNEYKIRKFINNGIKYVMGTDLYKGGKVKDLEISFDSEYNCYNVSAYVEENGNKRQNVQISIDFDGNIESGFCSCDDFECEHLSAVLLAAAEKKNDFKREIEDKISQNFFKAFEEMENNCLREKFAEEAGDLEIIPELILSHNSSLSARFFIGRDKTYKIKNIYKFLNQLKYGEEVKYGKFLTVDNSKDKYSDRAVKMINLMKIAVKAPSYCGAYGNDEINILPDIIDLFFDACLGENIKITIHENRFDEADVFYLNTVENKIPVKIEFNETDSGYEFKFDKDITFGMAGTQHGYIIADSSLYRADKQYFECILRFSHILRGNRIKSFNLENRDLAKFATNVLPIFIRNNVLDDYEEIQVKAGCYPLKTKVYIDYENEKVSLLGEFHYGDNSVNMLESEKAEKFPRNKALERQTKEIVEKLGFVPYKNKYFMGDADNIFDFYKSGINQLNKIADVYATDVFKGKEIRSNGRLSVGFRIKGDLLEVDFDESLFDYSQIEDVLKSYKVKKRFHRFKDGSLMDLSDESFEKELKLLENLEISKNDNGHFKVNKYRALAVNSFLKENNVFNAEYNDEFKMLAEDFAGFKNLDINIPYEVEGILRDYQKTGYKWLKTLEKYGFGGILADDMGLGKTLQAISLILSYREKALPSIIVCPTSLIYNWRNEMNKFAPELDVKVITGAAESRIEMIKKKENAVYITTYDTLKRDISCYRGYKFKYIIADEAQAIKNPKTQNAAAVKKLNGKMRVALTGTPIENSLTELWAIFDFLMPGYLYSLTKFQKSFAGPIIKDNDEEKQRTLKNMVMPFILRRVKGDVLTELPEKIETTLYAEMGEEQRKIYMAYFMESKRNVKNILDKANGGRIEVLSILTRLRQICCHPSLFLDNYTDKSGKLELTLETIESLISGGHRILLFSQFTSMLDLIAQRLEEMEIEYFYLSGATKADKRMDMAERFNGGESSVFLISLKAGGTGLNLIGADAVIHYDPWWNPAVMNQASDRAHRIGQKRSVQVFNMIAENTIEEKILALQEKKKNLTDNIITDGEAFFSQMTKEEILGLFEDNTL